jgi:hypothetical protein
MSNTYEGGVTVAIVQRDGVDGKVCSKCKEWKSVGEFNRNKSQRDGYNNQCRTCGNASYRAYHHRNKDEINQKKREEYADDPRTRLDRQKRTRSTWSDERRALQKSWQDTWMKNHPEESAKHQRRYRNENRDVLRKRASDWKKNHPNVARANKRTRYARKKGAKGKYTLGQWNKMKEGYNWTCPCCMRKEPEIKLTADHIVPLSKGGTNYITNIQPLCRNCNSAKGTQIIVYMSGVAYD